jgi:tetratricopeptide (TPR) repeat protein
MRTTTIPLAAFVLTAISVTALAQPVAIDDQTRRSIEFKIEEWRQEVADHPQDYKTLTAIGTAYGSLGRYSEALEFYGKAIVIRPAYADAHLGLATTYGFLGRPAEKIAECQAAIRLRPKYAEAHESLGISYGRVGRYQDAIRELKTALDLKLTIAQQADAHFALGLAYAFSGQFPAALAEQEALMTLDPKRGGELKEMIARVLAAAL